MSSRAEDVQTAFLRAWSAIVNPFPGAATADDLPGAADWLRAAWRESGGGAPAFAEAYRRFGEWVSAGLAGAKRGQDAAGSLAAMAKDLTGRLEAMLARPADDGDRPAATPASPWEQFAEALGGGRWPPETVFASTWFDLPGFTNWRRSWQAGTRAWLEQQAAVAALQRRQLSSLKDALDSFAERLLDERDGEADITSLKALFALWIDCAERAHEAALASDGYGREFGEFINAGAALRRAASELFAAFDVPARREFAAAAAAPDGTLTTLEARLRDTLREVAELRDALAIAEARSAAAPAAAASPARRAVEKKGDTAKRKAAARPAPASPAAKARPARKAKAPGSTKPRTGRATGEEFDIAAIGARRD